MEKEIRIKDLIFSIWDQRKIFAIVTLSLLIVSSLSIFLVGMNTKVYKTQIELQWNNIGSYKYPDNTRISRTDFIQEGFLEDAMNEAEIDLDIDKLYEKELIKTTYVQDLEKDASILTLNIELELSSLKINDEEAQKFVESLRKQYLSFVAKKSIKHDVSIDNYDVQSDEIIYGYDVLKESLEQLGTNLETVSSSNRNFIFDSKSVMDFEYKIYELLSEVDSLTDVMVDQNSNGDDVIYTYLEEDEAIKYIKSLGYSEKEQLVVLKDELAVLETTCTGTVADSSNCSPEIIVGLKNQIRELEEDIKYYLLLEETIDNNNYVFSEIGNDEKESILELKKEIQDEIDSLNTFVYQFKLQYLTMEYTMPAVYTVDKFGGMLYYVLALIASAGIPVVCIWIFEDWDKRIK